jgi:hypothetical protein
MYVALKEQLAVITKFPLLNLEFVSIVSDMLLQEWASFGILVCSARLVSCLSDLTFCTCSKKSYRMFFLFDLGLTVGKPYILIVTFFTTFL